MKYLILALLAVLAGCEFEPNRPKVKKYTVMDRYECADIDSSGPVNCIDSITDEKVVRVLYPSNVIVTEE